MVEVERFAHVVVTARDFQSALDFYANILGLPQVPRPDIGRPGAWFQIGKDSRLHVVEEAPPGKDTYRHISLEVADYDAALEEVLSKGVKPYRPPGTYSGGARELRLVDPGGNFIELYKEPAEPTG